MKTIEEFLKEVEASDALQNEMKAIGDKDAFEALLKKNDCGFTAEDLAKVIKAEEAAEGELTDDAAEAAAGGDWRDDVMELAKRFLPEALYDPLPQLDGPSSRKLMEDLKEKAKARKSGETV